MPSFIVEFEGSVPEFGSTVLTANDQEQAEQFAREYIEDAYPEMSDVVLTKVQEDI